MSAFEENKTLVEANGLQFPVQIEGDGPAVLLLHGFPDSHRLWRNQVPALVEAGYQVIVPDLRGFGDAPKPKGAENYRIPLVIRDVIGILDALQIEKVKLIGHDFGAATAWGLTAYNPKRVEKLAVLSVGHPRSPGRASLRQRELSWYMLYFQFEGVAEEWLRADNWQGLRDFMRHRADVEDYIADLARPGALTAGLNWYRGNLKPSLPLQPAGEFPAINCPVLGIWSDGDNYLLEDGLKRSGEVVQGPWRYEKIEGATHWLMVDRPDETNCLLLDFLAEK